MNIKRGLFRIWVLLTVMLIIGVAIFGWNPVQREFQKAKFEATWRSDPLAVPIFCEDARGILGKDYSIDGGKTYASPKDKCWYAMPTLRKLFPEFDKVSDDDLTKSTFQTVGEPSKRETGYHCATVVDNRCSRRLCFRIPPGDPRTRRGSILGIGGICGTTSRLTLQGLRQEILAAN